MSWLNHIYEGILTEITADEAYPRFYQKMPRQVFDTILGGETNVDKFYRFFLDCVRDGLSSQGEAVNAIKKFKESDDLIRQKILAKMRANEYETANEVSTDIDYFRSGGSVLSRKAFAKEGLVKLGGDERWRVTCTTNYTASNVYFPKTHWCTASDRNGDYDGYRMFKRYTGNDCVLIQFSWKGKVAEKDNYDISSSDEDRGIHPIEEQFDEKDGYISEVIQPSFQMFQIAINCNNGDIPQLCDFKDANREPSFLRKYVGEYIYSITTDFDTLKKLRLQENEQSGKEANYLDAIERVQKERRERRMRIFREQKNKFEERAEEFNSKQREIVEQKWNEFVGSEGYNDIDFLIKLLDRDVINRHTLTTEEIEETNFIVIGNNQTAGDVYIINLWSVYGKRANLHYNSRDIENPNFRLTVDPSVDFVDGECVLMVKKSGVGLEIVFSKLGADFSGPYWSSHNTDEYRFMYMEEDGNDDDDIVFDIKKGNVFKAPADASNRSYYLENDMYAFYYKYSDYWAIYDGNTGKAEIYEKSPEHRARRIDDDIAITMNGVQTVYRPLARVKELRKIVLPVTDIVDDLVTINVNGRYLVKIQFQNDGHWVDNFFFIGSDEFIFGVNGVGGDSNFDEEDGNGDYRAVSIRVKENVWSDSRSRKLTRLRYNYESGEYSILDLRKREWVPCDDCGRQEKHIRANRYIQDFLNNGGYSPETQAQMDQMWKDNDGGGEGKEALAAWNDDDNSMSKDALKGTDRYVDDDFFRGVQKFEPTDRKWSGRMMRKDPEAFDKGLKDWWGGVEDFKAKVGKNPWYRIDNTGKPIDQPWNDEDEIPANLSDRVVRESKIPHKLISLWNKLGLND